MGSESVGNPNRHVRVYLHTTFKEFMEERKDLARHAYPELLHLCFERGVAFSPIDLFWQVTSSALQYSLHLSLISLSLPPPPLSLLTSPPSARQTRDLSEATEPEQLHYSLEVSARRAPRPPRRRACAARCNARHTPHLGPGALGREGVSVQ